jgi:hypothetical protein
MKFMLMMHSPVRKEDWGMTDWTVDELKAMVRFMKNLNKELAEEGVLVGAEGLAPPTQARIVCGTSGGKPVVTDGPFPEAKEFLAGYWIVDVETPEQAYAIAGRATVAPGPGGKPMNIAIEVREVGAAPADM